jgi:para-nitrobenzyl esterase
MTMAVGESVNSTRVAAPAGSYLGSASDGVSTFRGIRFAEPPVGDLRFAAPVDAAPFGEIDARSFGAISLQDIDPLPRALPGTENNFYAPGIITSEDCLNLNIWTPDVAGSAPVLFWIHGGAFLYGSGTGPWADGTRFARDHGVVVVSVNYRLGLLGNLWLGDLDPTASNLGLQDQISALRWVERNIASFGGDPSAVTIAGQSAGAMSVAALMTAPAARGLFSRGIVESGHVSVARTLEDTLEIRPKILRELSIDPSGDILAQLRATSSLRILQVQREFGISILAFPTVADDVVLPSDLLGAIRDGSASGVDLIVGTNSEEDRLFTITGWSDETATTESVIAGLLPGATTAELDQALGLYRDLPGSDRDHQYLVNTDHGWATPAREFAIAQAGAGNRVYHYEYARRSSALDGRVGAAHLSELPVFWGNLDAPGVSVLLGEEVHTDPAVRKLAEDMSGTIAQFVRTGSPDGGPLGAWPSFVPDDRETMVIDVTSTVDRDHKSERLDFWAAHSTVPALSNVAGD